MPASNSGRLTLAAELPASVLADILEDTQRHCDPLGAPNQTGLARSFSDRAGRVKVPVPGHPVPGPDRNRPHKMGRAMETRFECFRCHLRRPVPGRGDLLMINAGNTVNEIDPSALVCRGFRR